MKFSAFATDDAVLAELGARMAGSRLARNLTQQQVADQAGVSKRTAERLEAGGSVQLIAFIRTARALGLIEQINEFLPAPGVSPIARMEHQGRTRRRASRRTEGTARDSDSVPWSWGPDGSADDGAGSRSDGGSDGGSNSDRPFHGLPGLLADSLPDRYGNAVIDAWLASQGRSPASFDAVERLCYLGDRGMGALEFVPAQGPSNTEAELLNVEQLVPARFVTTRHSPSGC